MGFRTVNGNTHTEDGWRCCNRDECDIVRIPDLFLTDTAPLRKGPPLVILGAWLFWYDRNVEEIVSPVWGWSQDNAVLGQPGRNNGSNHLSATAVDVNAPKYPWGTYRMPDGKIAKVEEGLRLFEGSVSWGRVWSKPDEMHYQMSWREGDPRNEAFAQKLLAGHLGIYRPGPPPPPPPPAPPPATGYGLPRGTRINYGAPGFPDWVYQLGNAFGVKPSTYPGHQESDRIEAGYARNPGGLNRGIDWAGSIDAMTRFADYLATIPHELEQVIWQNPKTGRSIEVAGGRHQPGYFAADLAGHRDHVHTRQSRPISIPGGAPPPPPPPPPAEDGALVLSKSMGGSVSLERYRELLPGFRDAVTRANAATPKRINMFTAQLGHESGGLKYMEEIADGSAYEGRRDLGNTQPGDGRRFKGRGPIQITGRHNYTKLSEWAHSKGFVPSPTFFVDQPAQLASPQYGFLGAIWYWTVARPKINEYCDWDDLEASLVAVTKAINGGTNGLADRRNRLNRARSMDLAPIMRGSTQPPTPIPGDDMALVPQNEWNEIRDLVRWIAAPNTGELRKRFTSRSPLRWPGEKESESLAGFTLAADAHGHIRRVWDQAREGDPEQLRLLRAVADMDLSIYTDRTQADKELAQAILADVTRPSARTPQATGPSEAVMTASAAAIAAEVATPAPVDHTRLLVEAYAEISILREELRAEIARLREENSRLQVEAARQPISTELAAFEPGPRTSGDRVAQLVDAVEDWTELALSMDVKQRAALAASLKVLQIQQNGTQS